MGSKSSKSENSLPVALAGGTTVGTIEEFDALPADQRRKTFEAMLVQLRGSEGGTWAEFSNIDMCCQGDVKIVGEWKSTTTIEEMKKIVEKNNWSAITVSAGEPSFGHAALKDFDFPLTPDLCKPISTCCKHPCTIYIYTPPPAFVKSGKPPEPPEEVPADSAAKALVLVKAGSPEQCVFEHAHKLAAGDEFVPLTLQSGKAIVSIEAKEQKIAHYHLFPPGVGNAGVAVRARLDKDGFLTREDNGFVFDIDRWSYAPGNKLWMLREHEDATKEATRHPDGGRSFKINEDGTISPTKAPELVLGVLTPEANRATVCYKEDVPSDFPLPTMGERFILACPFDNQDKVMEIFCHQVNCPIVFSHCCSPTCAHWYVSAINPLDGSFKLSITTAQGELNARLGVAEAGEVLSVVKQDGTWLVAEKHGKDRVRLSPRSNADLFITASSSTAEWGGRLCEMSCEANDANLLYVKPAHDE